MAPEILSKSTSPSEEERDLLSNQGTLWAIAESAWQPCRMLPFPVAQR